MPGFLKQTSRAENKVNKLKKGKSMRYYGMRIILFMLVCTGLVKPLSGQEAQKRWEFLNEIRREKFDLILPEVLRENNIDMWITIVREGYEDPLAKDFGEAYVGSIAYFIFTDRGRERIERAALGMDGYLLNKSGAYDIITNDFNLKEFVVERDPQTIALNYAENIPAADGLTKTNYEQLVQILGETYVPRFRSAEKLASDFRSRRVATEIAAFSRAGEFSRDIAEKALSNSVITPGVTSLADVAWWMMEQIHKNGLGSSFGLPSVYITGPEGIVAVSNDRVIQRGDFLAIDWGVGYLNLFTDLKRHAYVLKEGEITLPASIQDAFDNAVRVRDILKHNIKPGLTAKETYNLLNQQIEKAGFSVMAEFNKPTDDPEKVDVIIGCHSVGNSGHGIGPSIALFNPERLTYIIQPTNIFAIELFVYTAIPEWNGKKLRIPLEDDGIVTMRGVEWLYPVNQGVLLIK